MRDAADVLQKPSIEDVANHVISCTEVASKPAADETRSSGMPRFQAAAQVPDGRETDERIGDP